MTYHQALIVNLLDESIERLRNDLKLLEHRMKQDKKGMFIDRNDDPVNPSIIVYAPSIYRAYVPKRYDGWPVKFNDWDGEDIQIDLDLRIEF